MEPPLFAKSTASKRIRRRQKLMEVMTRNAIMETLYGSRMKTVLVERH